MDRWRADGQTGRRAGFCRILGAYFIFLVIYDTSFWHFSPTTFDEIRQLLSGARDVAKEFGALTLRH